VPRARRGHHGREQPKASGWICRIKNFCGRQWPGVACATGDKDAAVGQARRGVIYARGGERCANGRGLRFRIEDLGNRDEVPGVVASRP